jgi:short-subunit dehydrogenase
MKTALVTGASSGMGYGCAILLAQKGYRVLALARRENRLKELQEQAKNFPGTIDYLVCDITKEEDKVKLTNKIDQLGSIDLVLANAGIGDVKSIDKLDKAELKRIMDTNVYGVFDTVKLSLEKVKASKGAFGIVGSVQSYIVLPGSSAYCMSKYAVRAFSETLYLEMKKYGVGVTFIAPGFIDTEMRKKGFDDVDITHKDPVPKSLVMPLDIACKKIVHSIEKRKRELTLTFLGKLGQFIVQKCPGLFFFIISKLDRRKV